MNLMYNFLGLVSIDTPQQYLVFTFLVEDISVQEESHGKPSQGSLVIIIGKFWVLLILNISQNVMVPRVSIWLSLDASVMSL